MQEKTTDYFKCCEYYIQIRLSLEILSLKHIYGAFFINNFFRQEILNIHNGFLSSTLPEGMPLVEESSMSMMSRFQLITESDIRQLLNRSSNGFCAVDPMPTWLVKECLDVLISPVTKLDNKSLSLCVLS